MWQVRYICFHAHICIEYVPLILTLVYHRFRLICVTHRHRKCSAGTRSSGAADGGDDSDGGFDPSHFDDVQESGSDPDSDEGEFMTRYQQNM